MISIVGGTYNETCLAPQWDYLYGSGLRGAAVISELLSSNVNLHTYIDDDSKDLLGVVADTNNVSVKTRIRTSRIEFKYVHPLSVPFITPPLHLLQQEEPISVNDNLVLRYGMIEGEAIVKSKIAVYDPQSAESTKDFFENGSEAESVAIVLNRREGFNLTGVKETDAIVTILLDRNYEVVVLKSGANGAYVATKAKRQWIPAYRTKSVWPLGSGDVFSAVFAYYWGYEAIDPVSASNNASVATAIYCENQCLPISKSDISAHRYLPLIHNFSGNKQVYLAGPFFNLSQRWLIEEARIALFNQGLNVFSPLHDVGRGTAVDIAPADLEGLHNSSVVIAIVDGLDPGTIFEIGYARARGIPVIAYVENVKEEDLKMIEGSGCRIVSDFVSAIYLTVWELL